MEKAKNKAAIRKIAIGGTSALEWGTATSFAAFITRGIFFPILKAFLAISNVIAPSPFTKA